MNSFVSASVIAMTVLFLCAEPAHATAFHTYLSAEGNDANPCTRDQPCRYLPAALAQTEVNGEVTILDSGDFNVGTVTTHQGVTVAAAPGVRAVFVVDASDPSAGSTFGIQVIGPAGSQFTFRNLVFLGRGNTLPGNYIGIAVSFVIPGVGLIVEDSEFENLAYGILVIEDQGSVSVSRSRFQRNARGIVLDGGATTLSLQSSIDACTFTRNVLDGAFIGTRDATISHSRFTGNGNGVLVVGSNGDAPGGEAFLTENDFSSNGVGVVIGNGAFARSTQDNVFYINSTPVIGKLITQKKQ